MLRFDHLLEGGAVGEVVGDLSVSVVVRCRRGFRSVRHDLCLVAETGTTYTMGRVAQDTASMAAVQGWQSRNASQSRQELNHKT